MAAAKKEYLENKQREFRFSFLKVSHYFIYCVNRKEYKNKKESDWWTPRWFVPSKSPVTGEDDWRATGDFWKEDFSRSPQIF